MSDDLLDLTSSPDLRKNSSLDADSFKSKPPSKTSLKLPNSYIDNSDEDDYFSSSILAPSKKAAGKRGDDKNEEKRERDEAKKIAAEAARRRKEQVLEDKRIQKEMAQDEKRREKERIQHEKDAKNEERRVAAEMSGRFKDSEVSMIIEESLYNSEEGLVIIENLKQQSTERGDKEKPIQFLSARSRIPSLVRWTYRAKSDGGGCNIGEPKSRVMEFIVLLLSPEEFVSLVVQTTDFVDFAALGRFVDKVRTKASQTEGCPPGSRLTILLNDLDKEVNRLVRRDLVTVTILYYRRLIESHACQSMHFIQLFLQRS
jgi:hypothetical protein